MAHDTAYFLQADSESDESSGDEADAQDHLNLFGTGTMENFRGQIDGKRSSEANMDCSPEIARIRAGHRSVQVF